MGNAASVSPADEAGKVDVTIAKKDGNGSAPPKKKKKKKKAPANDEPNMMDGQMAAFNSPGKSTNLNDDDVKPVDILLQYIPYYGQGDPSNDSIVRATLNQLSIDEIDSKDEYGNTLLLLACQYKCDDLVRIMLGKGADPNAINSSGACCLHFACYNESASYDAARVLLQNGANPEIAELSYGCTPLHYCAGTGEIEFCKLLLSHGAMVNTADYYSYTCVDYAREAGMTECMTYLQQQLDRYNAAHTGGQGRTLHSPASAHNLVVDTTWVEYTDPLSGGKYFINSHTSETLWETDLRDRLQQESAAAASVRQSNQESKGDDSDEEDDEEEEQEELEDAPDPWLVQQTSRARLIGFFGRYDPSRLVEVDKLLEEYKGRESQMLQVMCTRYGAPIETELAAFNDKLMELTASHKGASGGGIKTSSSASVLDGMNVNPSPESKRGSGAIGGLSTDFKLGSSTPVNARGSANGSQSATPTAAGGGGGVPGGMDPAMVKKLMNEERAKYDAALEKQKGEGRSLLSQKDGEVAKLQSELESLLRERANAEEERKQLMAKLERASGSAGEALKAVEDQLAQAQVENAGLKEELNSVKQNLTYEKEKLMSLENTVTNLSAGKEEALAREKEAAEERARVNREREAQHQAEIKANDEKVSLMELKFKDETTRMKNDFALQERELRTLIETMRKSNEASLHALEEEIAQKKAKMTAELSQARMEMEDSKKFAEEQVKRADAAEAIQKQMQAEVMEARQIASYNDRLHKDLAREQLARKRLHNEMEDMKGRIRVYVRVRPFSGSELEKSCKEACFKDGKLSVVVTGIGDANAKKVYDFDQVFGGKEGNTQKDVFRDTKHLIMSVVDGYNVCIFAYGQTGAGKSFTMIGAADIGECLKENGEFDDLAGITPRAVSELFRLLNERTAQVEYSVEVSMFQLYRDGLDDLLAEKKKPKKGEEPEKEPSMKITLAEHSPTGLVQVEGATCMIAESPGDVMKIFAKGSARRTTASTQMNAESSRSHLICSLVVKLKNRRNQKESVGKLTLVDLAGSERVDKSGATGDVLKEAQSINKSLSALGDVIAALTSGTKHVPYRNHPLTMLMSDSLGGNSKTLMFVNTSPADYNNSESNSSLAFASRCKDITNSVAQGGAVQAAQMNALKKQLAQMKKGGGGGKGLARPAGR